MGALFHDVGMGVSQEDFALFRQKLALPEPGSEEEAADMIRANHQELSGLFLQKYWPALDLPGEQYAHAVIQVCRGHRKTSSCVLSRRRQPRPERPVPGRDTGAAGAFVAFFLPA